MATSIGADSTLLFPDPPEERQSTARREAGKPPGILRRSLDRLWKRDQPREVLSPIPSAESSAQEELGARKRVSIGGVERISHGDWEEPLDFGARRKTPGELLYRPGSEALSEQSLRTTYREDEEEEEGEEAEEELVTMSEVGQIDSQVKLPPSIESTLSEEGLPAQLQGTLSEAETSRTILTLMSMMERLEMRMQREAEANARYRAELRQSSVSRTLPSRVPAPPPGLPQPQPVLAPAPRYKPPKFQVEFSGEPRELRSFLWAARGFLADHRQEFPNEAARVRAIVVQLKGDASDWAMSLVEANDPSVATTANLLAALETRFRDPTLRRKAWNSLKALKQGTSSVSQYVDTFRRLANQATDMPPLMLIEIFLDGLRSEILSWCLQRPEPTNLNDWYDLAKVAETNLDRVKKLQPPKPTKKPPTAKGTKPGPKLDEAEKSRRFREGLCLRCGQPGHRAAECSGKPETGARPKEATKPKGGKPKPKNKPASAAVETTLPEAFQEGLESAGEASAENDSGPE